MSSEQSFMEAILQSPDDDALRLIFADWLEERGDPRGEFIRVQYALLDEKMDERRRFELKTREQELIAEHGPEWAGQLLSSHAQSCHYQRGLVEHVTFDAESFVRHAVSLFATHPIRFVQILRSVGHSWEIHLAWLFECPQLDRVEELHLPRHAFGDSGVHMLVECPYLQRLRCLRLDLNGIGLDGARTLASAALPGLRRLCMNGNPIEDLGFQALCASQTLDQLKTLEVEGIGLTLDGLRGAGKDFRLANLEDLHLGKNWLDRQALAVLARFPFAGRLRVLRLNFAHLNSVAIQPLTDSLAFSALQTLDLGNNQLTDFAAQHLARSPHLTNLQHLHLGGNNISPAGREVLKARFGPAVTF